MLKKLKLNRDDILKILSTPKNKESNKKSNDEDSYKVDIGNCTYIFQKKQKYDTTKFQNIHTENIVDMMDYHKANDLL